MRFFRKPEPEPESEPQIATTVTFSLYEDGNVEIGMERSDPPDDDSTVKQAVDTASFFRLLTSGKMDAHIQRAISLAGEADGMPGLSLLTLQVFSELSLKERGGAVVDAESVFRQD